MENKLKYYCYIWNFKDRSKREPVFTDQPCEAVEKLLASLKPVDECIQVQVARNRRVEG